LLVSKDKKGEKTNSGVKTIILDNFIQYLSLWS